MTEAVTCIDLSMPLDTLPADGILSRTVYHDEQFRAVLFGFAAGQELSEHTAAVPAVIHILQGDAWLTLGGEGRAAGPGTWVHMPANLPHSVLAKTPVTMLLTMLKK